MESSTHSLADSFFSKSQQRVLSLLFGDTERSFFANEIIRHAGGGAGAIHRELESLTRAGVLSEFRIGNQRHFQANQACPIFTELKSIIRKTLGIAGILRDTIQPFTDQIIAAFIYGSIARGEETTGSDIDLLIISETLAYPDLFSGLAEAEKNLGRTINPNIYKSEELQRKLDEGYAFVTRIMTQPKILIFGSESDLPKPAQSG